MSLVLHLSDTHFGTERPAVVEALVTLAQRLRPDLVIFSGDITQRATVAQFAAARRFVDRLAPAPLLAIPGNHDIPLFNPLLRAVAPYARHRRQFGRELEPELFDERWMVLALRTTRRWRHEDGELSQRQIDRVAARVRLAAPQQLRMVVVHQPIAVPRADEAHNLLRHHERAIRSWNEAGVDLVLGGHIHLPAVLALHEQMPDLARPMWAVQAGTAVSSRVRHEADNSFNLLRVQAQPMGGRSCVVERWDWQAALRRFEAVQQHHLSFDRIGVPAAAPRTAATVAG